jgi:hypothetical protein
MARDDNFDDELPQDNMAGLANAMIILTGVALLVAIFIMMKASGDMYGVGMFAP